MTIYAKTHHLAARTIEGQAYIINTRTSMLHELDETGTFLWENMGKSSDEESLVKLLLNEYDVSPESAKTDVGEFLRTLESLGIVEHRA